MMIETVISRTNSGRCARTFVLKMQTPLKVAAGPLPTNFHEFFSLRHLSTLAKCFPMKAFYDACRTTFRSITRASVHVDLSENRFALRCSTTPGRVAVKKFLSDHLQYQWAEYIFRLARLPDIFIRHPDTPGGFRVSIRFLFRSNNSPFYEYISPAAIFDRCSQFWRSRSPALL